MSSRDYIYIIELLYELMKIIHIKHLGFPGGSVVKNLPATAEAKDIKKRWQEYTEDLCSKIDIQKILTTQITTIV